MAREGGAHPLTVVNAPNASLAEGAHALSIATGTERAMAATKSFAGTLAALARLVAAWSGDRPLRLALDRLPDVLERAIAADRSEGAEVVAVRRVGRSDRARRTRSRERLARPGRRSDRLVGARQCLPVGGNRMGMATSSLLNFAELYRRGGATADGKRVVPAEWIRRSWRPHARSRWTDDGYG